MIRRKAAMAGVGTIVMAGVVYMAWKKSANHRARYKDWKKEKIQNIGYNSWDLIDEIDERDIAWG